MTELTGAYWDRMHMTFSAHVDGLYMSAKMADLDSARELLKAAKRYYRDGQHDQAMWAAIEGARQVSDHWNANCVGRVDV